MPDAIARDAGRAIARERCRIGAFVADSGVLAFRAGSGPGTGKGWRMQDIVELERRIVAALARIGHGIDALPPPRAPEGPAPPVPEVAPAVEKPQVAPAGPEGHGAGAGAGAGDGKAEAEAEASHLSAQVEAERSTVLRLRQRLAEAREQEAALRARYERRIAELGGLLDARGQEMQRLRDSAGALADELRHLREAAEGGLEPAQVATRIDRALKAEVEALRALRAGERAELDELLAALDDHLTEAENA